MGLTITATFEKQGPYFAGDTLECHIRFANVHTTRGSTSAGRGVLARSMPPLPGSYVDTSSRRGSSAQPLSHRFMSRAPSQSGAVVGGGRGPVADEMHFPGLDDSSMHSTGSALAPNSESQYRSTVSGLRDGNCSPSTQQLSVETGTASQEKVGIDQAASDRRRGRDDTMAAPSATAHQRYNGLAVFPASADGSPVVSERVVRSEVPQLAGVRESRKASAHGDRALLGMYKDRAVNTDPSPMEPQRQPWVRAGRKPSAANERGSLFPRLSTSSILSTPTASLASWLPFGNRQQADTSPIAYTQRYDQGPSNDGGSSDGGSNGSFLGSLWRNISGSSNRPSRAGTMGEDDYGVERLAIGFVEASGSLALASSYIRPDQLGLLVKHGGTGYGLATAAATRSPPIGGGLGGWVPTSPRSHSASRTQRSIPVLVSSSEVLFSELELAPGESQTFSIRVQLPPALPPSFRGRVASVAYDLVVVAKRDMLEQNAYAARIPFCVLGRLGDGTPDVLSFDHPIRMPPGHIQLTFHESDSISTPRNASPTPGPGDFEPSDRAPGHAHTDTEALTETERGGREINVDSMYTRLVESDFLQQLLRTADANGTAGGSDDLPDAADERIALELCRRKAPVEFSLSQGGRAVASVWLPRRAYQLGDIVVGKIRLYPESATIYHVCVWLESTEKVNGRFASYEPGRTEELTRKIYAEHHELCRGLTTLGFSLALPQAAAASFSSDIVSNVWQLRIELIIAAPAGTPCDLALSAATLFPPTTRPSNGTRDVPLPMPTSPAGRFPAGAGTSGKQGRPRSSTVIGSSSALRPSPPLPFPGASDPPPSRPSPQADRRTMRRRYDAVREIPAQTLSCTVPIHICPPPLNASSPAQNDSYSVELSRHM
ncbi:Golgi membrane exchange factor (Ric1p-Rgp1p) subunit [Coemansia guatemalensis]|uniref:Golgi membrane exchange factor (Ric1p-Rgp1p) subunit n=1 Tax=Coemansia guatemalensis TaxID=2761395 RepID=A0A9W8LVA9_9FUNG|nr:Golgi membrane exchange factor (Ric1p-Rgp1p) subunit [Coemansia guatemalensis]